MVPIMDNHVLSLAPSGDVDLNLNEDSNNGLKEVNNELGLADTQPNKLKTKWTRISRMDVGLSDLNITTSKLKLGERLVGNVLDEDCEEGSTMLI